MAVLSGLSRLAKAAALKSRQATPPEEGERPTEVTELPLMDVQTIKKALLQGPSSFKILKEKLMSSLAVPDLTQQPAIETFMSRLGATEGTKAHISLEGGGDTGAFGIKDSKGLVRLPKEEDKEFAERVVRVHEGEIVEKVGAEKWSALPREVQGAVLDLKFNTGTIGSGLAEDIQKGDDIEAIMLETLDTAKATIMEDQGEFKKGDKILSPGLAKRRAARWNEVFPDRKIKQVSFEEEGRRTSVTYHGDEGPIFSYSTKAKVSSDFRAKTGDTTIQVQ